MHAKKERPFLLPLETPRFTEQRAHSGLQQPANKRSRMWAAGLNQKAVMTVDWGKNRTKLCAQRTYQDLPAPAPATLPLSLPPAWQQRPRGEQTRPGRRIRRQDGVDLGSTPPPTPLRPGVDPVWVRVRVRVRMARVKRGALCFL